MNLYSCVGTVRWQVVTGHVKAKDKRSAAKKFRRRHKGVKFVKVSLDYGA